MLLIADSGATKTDWRLIDSSKVVHSYSTQGISPYFLTTEQIVEILTKELIAKFDKSALIQEIKVFYYGTGCASDQKSKVVYDALKILFTNSKIVVDSDMLGAAKALYGNDSGMVAILGTGCNAGYYNGKIVRHDTVSLGYLLGDEGSGAHIGKTFITALLYDEVPQNVSKIFFEQNKMSKADILDAIYKKPFPNRFLASFSTFIKSNINEKYIYDIVFQCFSLFFEKHICKYPEHKSVSLSLVGSIAFNYSDILRECANKYQVKINKIIQSPIDDLLDYHAIG